MTLTFRLRPWCGALGFGLLLWSSAPGAQEREPGWEARLVAAPVAVTSAGRSFPSSSRVLVSWLPPSTPILSYQLSITDTVTGETYIVPATATSAILTGLKSATTYAFAIAGCVTSDCAETINADTTASSATAVETWQVAGTGNSFATATRVVRDGNTKAYAFPYGAWAGATLAGKLQLYYDPSGTQGNSKGIRMAMPSAGQAAASTTSFDAIPGYGLRRTCAEVNATCTADNIAASVRTFQAVPLSSELGSRVRLYFEAMGADARTRILQLDSHDGYVGRDFHAGAATSCEEPRDFRSGGGCEPSVVIPVMGDAGGWPNIYHARQFKIGYPTLTDWRWNGATGSFMVVTVDVPPECSRTKFVQAYAVWSGTAWEVQYGTDGCPRLFEAVQAPMPVHLGQARYKLYFNDNPVLQGLPSSPLTDIKPMRLIYADAARTGDPAIVDFDDWEPVAQARGIDLVWPDGSPVDETNESHLDDYVVLMPTSDPSVQVMYSNMSSTGSTQLPFIGMLVLRNP